MSTTEKGGADLEKALARKERDWQSMIRITHDFFHAWRKSVKDKQGEAAAKEMELAFWENVGVGTGEMYLKRGGKPEDLEQIAFTMQRASDVMGETAHMKKDGQDVLVVHTACPWMDSFRAAGLPNQCGEGCDRWFQVAAQTISPKVRVVTESQLPRGGDTCTRRFTLIG
ncbi:MAG: hypothetical protein DPW12_09890 [Rhodocyclaceae bacterium]|nr:hypothetical protein [Rhodocyclaceae bacterium]HNQ57856.1 L-2-amino-thiazoline-4-carboxylic acid hydrolase [Candidatus Desulfobacillus denitrificans]HNT63810.1 L-2-amino-thiazoline-4-carboxylic acid hydrolase [Candidatus Desulfobacillus denitrificans]